jgi:flagella basal body P-ring formation protein FlgA
VPASRAQNAPSGPDGADANAPAVASLVDQARALVQAGTANPAAGIERVSVEIGNLDPRLKLAPCEDIKVYLPRGVRLIGRSNVGLRCERGPRRWNVYLPVTVRAYGRALVAATPLAAGTRLDPAQLTLAEVELTSGQGSVYRQAASVAGRELAQPLAAGATLRSHQLRARQWFAAGDQVRILASGNGFAIRGTGEALSPGIEGRSARVRTESGRVVTCQPVAEQTVELTL